MPIRVFSIMLVSVLIAACAAPSQREVEQQVDQAVSEELPEVSQAWQTATAAGPVQVGWIDSFNDPVLSRLVREAQANNPSLRAAAASVEQARALARQAGANLTPDINLTAGAGRGGRFESDNAPGNQFDVGLQVGWELDLWGRIRSGTAQAAASAQAAEADYRFAQYSLAANTAIAYFTAIEANVQTSIAQNNLSVLERTQGIVDAQFAEGLASAQDVALSRTDLASAREQVVTLEGAQRSALRALELLLGRYPAADIEVREALPDAPESPPAGVPSELLERRPDLIAAERQVAAAFNATNQAKAARLPSLSLTGNLGGSSSELSDVLNPANVAWNIGTSLLAPIFDGGRLRENVTIATAEQEASLAQYADAALRSFSDVETALDQGVVLDQREQALHEAVDQASEAYRLADLRYREGETSLLDLLTIQQRELATRSNRSSVQRLLLEQRISLHLALGGSWE